jgi:hypothetical protein
MAAERLRIGNGRHLGAEVLPVAGGPRSHRTGAGQLTRQLEVRSDERGRLHVPLWNLESLGPEPAPNAAPKDTPEPTPEPAPDAPPEPAPEADETD